MKRFADLSEQEILALAITNEDEDNRIYRNFADGLRSAYPDTAKSFDEMAEQEIGHRQMLLDLHRDKFGDCLPLVRRQDVKGFVARKPIWLNRPLGLDAVRNFAEEMEFETARFYRRAAETARDAAIKDLLTQLAKAEDEHKDIAHHLGEQLTPKERASEDETARRMFMLQYVQPGLAGLMDGSVSTLAPLFAAAFATHNTWATFLVGMAASIGAGISMAFAEALVGRRLADRPRRACGARRCHWHHDCDRRAWAHPALSHSALRHCDQRRGRRGGDRTRRDFVDPHPFHGYAVPARGVSGRGWRRAGVHRRDIDREFVTAALGSGHDLTRVIIRESG